MNERDKLLRKSRKSHNSGIKDEYKSKRNQVSSMIRTAKSNYTRSLLQENAHDPIKFWSTIKRIFPCKSKKCRVEQSFDIDGTSTSNPSNISNGFCDYFTNIVSSMKKIAYPLIDFNLEKAETVFISNKYIVSLRLCLNSGSYDPSKKTQKEINPQDAMIYRRVCLKTQHSSQHNLWRSLSIYLYVLEFSHMIGRLQK